MHKELEHSFSTDGLKYIDINIKEGAIRVYETNQDEVTVRYKQGNLFKKLLISKEGERTIIKQKKLFLPINIMLSQTKVFIGIPKSYKKDIIIKNSTGTVNVSDISVSKINVYSYAGLIDIDDIKFNSLNLKVGTRGCNVKLKEQSGDIYIKSLVGKVDLSIHEVGGNLTLNSGTRGSTISIPEDAPIKINKLNNKVKLQSIISSENKYLFDLKPHVGVIKVINI